MFLLVDPEQKRSIFPDAEKAACSKPLHPSGGTKCKGMLPGQVERDIKFMEHFRSLHFWFSLKPRGRNGQIQMGPQNELTGLSWGLPIFPQTLRGASSTWLRLGACSQEG